VQEVPGSIPGADPHLFLRFTIHKSSELQLDCESAKDRSSESVLIVCCLIKIVRLARVPCKSRFALLTEIVGKRWESKDGTDF
jgi:hypothetical protein